MDYQARLRRYEQEFAWAIEQAFPMTEFTYNGFKELQQSLDLSDTDVLPIEHRLMVHAESRYNVYQDKLQRYKVRFRQAVDRQFPLSESTQAEFEDLQQTLGLKDADVQQVERPIRVSKEVEKNRQMPIAPTAKSDSSAEVMPDPIADAESTMDPPLGDETKLGPLLSNPAAEEEPTDLTEETKEETTQEDDRTSSALAPHLNATKKVELHEIVDYTPPADAGIKSPSSSDRSDDSANAPDSTRSDDQDKWDDSDENWDELDAMAHPESNPAWDDMTDTRPKDDQPLWGDETETSSQQWDDLADTTDHHNGSTRDTAAEIMAGFMAGGSKRDNESDGDRHETESQTTLPTIPFDDDDDPRERYTRLESLLEAGLWKEADAETMTLMLARTGRINQGWLDRMAIEEFPCIDLRIIDTLWLQYSEGRFGFSVQKRIYDELPRRTAVDFGKEVGWWAKGVEFFKYYPLLRFARSAPPGHFPAKWFWQLSWQETLPMGNAWGGRGGTSRDQWMLVMMMLRIEQCNL